MVSRWYIIFYIVRTFGFWTKLIYLVTHFLLFKMKVSNYDNKVFNFQFIFHLTSVIISLELIADLSSIFRSSFSNATPRKMFLTPSYQLHYYQNSYLHLYRLWLYYINRRIVSTYFLWFSFWKEFSIFHLALYFFKGITFIAECFYLFFSFSSFLIFILSSYCSLTKLLAILKYF